MVNRISLFTFRVRIIPPLPHLEDQLTETPRAIHHHRRLPHIGHLFLRVLSQPLFFSVVFHLHLFLTGWQISGSKRGPVPQPTIATHNSPKRAEAHDPKG